MDLLNSYPSVSELIELDTGARIFKETHNAIRHIKLRLRFNLVEKKLSLSEEFFDSFSLSAILSLKITFSNLRYLTGKQILM